MPFDIFGTLFGGVSSLISNIVNWFSTEKTNQTNKDINQQNLDYNTAQTQAQWERDDNAHQREVADLKAAGLSPLAATNGANTSQALSAPNPIAMQAPQVDANGLINSMLESKALAEQERHNRVQEGQKYTELHQQAETINQKAQEISIENKKVEETIRYNSLYLKHLDEQLTEVNRSNTKQEELKKLQIKSEEYFKSIQQQTKGKFNYKVYTDVDKYEAALSVWANEFESFINQFLDNTSESHSEANNSNWNGSVGANIMEKGGNLGLGHSSGSSASDSYNVSQKQQAEMDKWYAAHPMPVYITYTVD